MWAKDKIKTIKYKIIEKKVAGGKEENEQEAVQESVENNDSNRNPLIAKESMFVQISN